MSLNLVHSCFNLILIVPDQVINWVGGHASATPGRDDNERTRNAMNVLGAKLEHYLPRPGSSGGQRDKGQKSGDGFRS